MSDWLILGLFAIGFYLVECCTWTPATVFACYRKPLRIRWAAAPGSALPGNESGGLAFSDPLTLSGTIIHSAHWPIAISPEGLCIDSDDASRFWTFDEIRTVACEERTVRLNGESAFRASSQRLAIELASQIAEIKGRPHRQRAEAVRSAIGQSFDVSMLRSRWIRFLKASRALSILSALPVVWLVLVAPIALLLAGPLRSWPYLLGGLFIAALAVSSQFLRVHRRELHGVSDRWLHAVSMTLFPIAAIRAVDRLSKEVVSHFSPFAVAGEFCGEDDGDRVLRQHGFDLELGVNAVADSDAARCRQWYRAQQIAAFRGLLKSLGRDPFARPEPMDSEMVVYCPRCHGQFGEGTNACSDCVGVQLVPLAGEFSVTSA